MYVIVHTSIFPEFALPNSCPLQLFSTKYLHLTLEGQGHKNKCGFYKKIYNDCFEKLPVYEIFLNRNLHFSNLDLDLRNYLSMKFF